MHSFEQNWSYEEFESVPKMVAEVVATNLDTTDVAMDTLKMSSSPNDARTRQREFMLATEEQSIGCHSIRWGQSYPAGHNDH